MIYLVDSFIFLSMSAMGINGDWGMFAFNPVIYKSNPEFKWAYGSKIHPNGFYLGQHWTKIEKCHKWAPFMFVDTYKLFLLQDSNEAICKMKACEL